MKFLESTFNEYIQEVERINMHKYVRSLLKQYKTFSDLNHLILYGNCGIGKYSQALYLLSTFSKTKLKYEKKCSIPFQNKGIYNFKLSDIHYEVDFEQLGCNAKTLWNDLYQQIIDIVSTKPEKQGIILCKNFHTIDVELMDVFYHYITNDINNCTIKFIFITECISFLPNSILDICDKLHMKRPSKIMYNKILPTKSNKLTIETSSIKNIKNIKQNDTIYFNENYNTFCDSIIDELITSKINLYVLREKLYALLIYQFNIYDCFWYIINTLYERKNLKFEDSTQISIELYKFFYFYNNNYRPIFHLENFCLYLCKQIHGL